MADKYYVSAGKSITLARGVVGPGEEVKSSDISNPYPAKDKSFSQDEIVKMKNDIFKELIANKLISPKKAEKEKEVIDMDLRKEPIKESEKSKPDKEYKTGGFSDGAKKK